MLISEKDLNHQLDECVTYNKGFRQELIKLLEIQKEIHFPHSLGLLYSAFTYYTGFKVNSGEYKVMGLAPYGNPVYVKEFRDVISSKNGKVFLNQKYFIHKKVGITTNMLENNDIYYRFVGIKRYKNEVSDTPRTIIGFVAFVNDRETLSPGSD